MGGITPLMHSVLVQDRRIFYSLLHLGALVQATDVKGWVVVLYAALGQSVSLFNRLMRDGSYVKSQDWPILVEAAMELDPKSFIADATRSLRAPLHKNMLSSPAQRARAAWCCISAVQMDRVVWMPSRSGFVCASWRLQALRLQRGAQSATGGWCCAQWSARQ